MWKGILRTTKNGEINALPLIKAQPNSRVAEYWFKIIVNPKMPSQTYDFLV